MATYRNQRAITAESEPYDGTCGESRVACQNRFAPAFCNRADGRVELARLPNGNPAPMHLITALPQAWAARCDAKGHVLALIDSIEAGFVKNGRFYSREEAARENARS